MVPEMAGESVRVPVWVTPGRTVENKPAREAVEDEFFGVAAGN
jgi:hypothetical protein